MNFAHRRRKKQEKKDIMRLEAGPASALSAMSRRGFLKYRVFIGTGFAQPKPKSSIETVPIGSRCFSGLRERRPKLRAVGSPSLYAAYPWDTSCTVRVIRVIITTNREIMIAS